MISFKHFLNEDTTSDMSPEEAAKLVAKMCKPYLKKSGFSYNNGEITGGIYRGFQGARYFINELSGTVTRQPRDSSIMLHNVINSYMMDKFKYPYRSKGVFCSGSKHDTVSYGRAFLMFPVGTFKFVNSTQITDAYTDLEGSPGSRPALFNRIMADMSEEFNKMLDEQDEFSSVSEFGRSVAGETPPDLWFKLVGMWLRKENPYSDTNLKKAIKSRAEIVIQCDDYYLVDIFKPATFMLSDKGKIFLETLMEEITGKSVVVQISRNDTNAHTLLS